MQIHLEVIQSRVMRLSRRASKRVIPNHTQQKGASNNAGNFCNFSDRQREMLHLEKKRCFESFLFLLVWNLFFAIRLSPRRSGSAEIARRRKDEKSKKSICNSIISSGRSVKWTFCLESFLFSAIDRSWSAFFSTSFGKGQ